MAGNKLVRRLAVAVRAPALSQHVFFPPFQHREPPDFLKITGEAGFGPHTPIRGRQPNHDLHRVVRNGTSTVA